MSDTTATTIEPSSEVKAALDKARAAYGEDLSEAEYLCVLIRDGLITAGCLQPVDQDD